jgi:phosphoglycerate dehydrogenase-like enzyme
MLVRYAKSHANLILTPHIGGATKEALPAAEMHMALKLRRAWTHAAL